MMISGGSIACAPADSPAGISLPLLFDREPYKSTAGIRKA